MEIGIVSSFAGAKRHAGAMWIHHFMIMQAVMKEAQVSSDVYLPDAMTIRDGDWNRSFIYTVRTPFHGTSCYWSGNEMTLRGYCSNDISVV